jgi:hypothetical protein
VRSSTGALSSSLVDEQAASSMAVDKMKADVIVRIFISLVDNKRLNVEECFLKQLTCIIS